MRCPQLLPLLALSAWVARAAGAAAQVGAAGALAAAAADGDDGQNLGPLEFGGELQRLSRSAQRAAVRRGGDKCREVVQREMKKYQDTVRRLTNKINALERDLRSIFEDKKRQQLVIGELRDNISSHARRMKAVMEELNITKTGGSGGSSLGGSHRLVVASTATTPAPSGHPTDCSRMHEGEGALRYRGDAMITIQPDRTTQPFKVLCRAVNEHGWIVIQRRSHGLVNFNRGWDEYKKGFGELSDEFWLGNEKIHQITSRGNYTVRFDMEDLTGNTYWAEYGSFRIDGEAQQYRAHVGGGYRGDAGDSLLSHHSSVDGARFSTFDRDNDAMFYQNCADVFMGGWWYNDCRSHINGEYAPKELQNSVFMTHGVIWSTPQQRRPLQSIVVMLRRADEPPAAAAAARLSPAATAAPASPTNGRVAAAAAARSPAGR